MIFPRLAEYLKVEESIVLASHLLAKMSSRWGGQGQSSLLRQLVQHFSQHQQTWVVISQHAHEGKGHVARHNALELLSQGRKDDPATWDLISRRACEDAVVYVRQSALQLLARGRKDDLATWDFISQRACEDKSAWYRFAALKLLVNYYKLDQRTLIILSRDLNGDAPSISMFQAIRAIWVEKCAGKLQISVDEVWIMFRKLNDILPLKLDLSARY